MTIKYFKSRKNDSYGDLLLGSKFLQQISRPEGLNTGDVTVSKYNIISHPTEDEHALVVVSDEIPVHPMVRALSNGTGNFPQQEAFINNSAESARIKNLLKGSTKVQGHSMVPARWDEKTYEQLEEEGFFQEIEPI